MATTVDKLWTDNLTDKSENETTGAGRGAETLFGLQWVTRSGQSARAEIERYPHCEGAHLVDFERLRAASCRVVAAKPRIS
jgi:hypothetical protein